MIVRPLTAMLPISPKFILHGISNEWVERVTLFLINEALSVCARPA